MLLEINQELQEFPFHTYGADDAVITLMGLMGHLYPTSTDGIAVAIGDQVVARSDWATTILKEKDKLLIITASQGG